MASFATQNTETTHAESGGSDLTFTAANSLEISIPSSQNISITPNSEGSFTSGSITVGVGTNNPYGYKLTMTTTTTDLTRTVPLSDGTTPTIPTLASNGSGYTEETFTTNTWGYKLSTDTNYYPVTSVMPVASTTSTTGGSLNTSTVDFATKLDNTKPSGTYGIILTFVATIKDLPTSTTFNNAFDFAGKDTVYKDGQRYYKMQDMSGFICSMVATPTDTTSAESTQLIDTRDNKIYWVSKLKDGNCWMSDDLDLGSNSNINLTPDDTDIANDVTFPAVQTSNDVVWASSWLDTDGAATFRTYSNVEYGKFYNWYTATAGTGDVTALSGDASGSICPKGFMLPTSTHWKTLVDVYGINSENADRLLLAPIKISNDGLYYYNTFWNGWKPKGTAIYWSSTSLATLEGISLIASSLDFDYNSDYFNAEHTGAKVDGYKVRCLARTDLTIEDATYLQDVTPEMRQNTAIGTTTTVLDKRDNNEYTIGKLEDGNIWLLDNLRLGAVALAEPLSTNNTNMSPSVNFTLPASSTDKFNDDTAGWTTPGINTSLSNTMSINGVYQGNIGVYYNYCAASAGTICAPKGENTSNASYDICPKDWRMPTGGASGEYQALYTAYSSNYTNFQTALRTPLSGIFLDGSAGSQGSIGSFWSSTKYDGSSMYRLDVGASYVNLKNSYLRRIGYPVRCVLK